MLRKTVRLAAGLLAVFTLLVAGLAVAALARWKRTFPAPETALRASAEPAVVERGRYLAYGPAHCVGCHTSAEDEDQVAAGATPPLSGGRVFELPIGTFRSPNLTPDAETGIGRRTDADLVRILRYGVRADSRAALPFMEYHDMSDDDLTAVISFLRSQPPVRRAVPDHDVNLVGRAILAFVLEPKGPSAPGRTTAPPEEPTVERGAYLANSVAACAACHTKRSLVDGSYVGPRLAGGFESPVDGSPRKVTVSPNLTPARTGRITAWSEEQFVGRFGVGVGLPGTHMPWRSFQRMSETDRRAIFRYLRSLPPVENDTGPSLQDRG